MIEKFVLIRDLNVDHQSGITLSTRPPNVDASR